VLGQQVHVAQRNELARGAHAERVVATIGHGHVRLALVNVVNVSRLAIHVHRNWGLHPTRVNDKHRHLREPARRRPILIKCALGWVQKVVKLQRIEP
jgi:hypothetical protein